MNNIKCSNKFKFIYKMKLLNKKWFIALLGIILCSILIPPIESSPQISQSSSSVPIAWKSQIDSLSGQSLKLNVPPLIHLDTSSKYYKQMIDGMIYNFKKFVNKASERSFSLSNSTTSTRQINLIGQNQQKVTIQDLQIDGLDKPKVSNVYVNSKNMKLHVNFNYKTIKVYGKCLNNNLQKLQTTTTQNNNNNNKILLEATNWNTSWSASLIPMIGRKHFDSNKVYNLHSQQRLSLNLKECPQILHEKLKIALIDRIRQQIELRINEIMEIVMMQSDSLNDDNIENSFKSSQPKERGKRASGAIGAATKQANLVTKNSSTGSGKKSPTQSVQKQQIKGKVLINNNKTSPKKTNPIISATQQPQQSRKVKQQQQQIKVSGGVKQRKQQRIINTKSKRSQENNNNNSDSFKMNVTPKFNNFLNNSNQVDSQKPLKRNKRDTPCQQGEELDDYVDQLFRFGTRIVRAMEPITTPNATIELPDYNLKIFLYDGKGTRAYKFRRAKSAWVFCNNDTISLGLTIEVEELRVSYKYRVISGNRLLFDGDFEAKVSPKVQAQFSQKKQDEDSEDPVQQRVDRVRVFRLGRVHVIIRGLGNLTQSLSMIINSYLNDNQEELQPTFRMVEGDAVRFINRMLANVKVPLLSAV